MRKFLFVLALYATGIPLANAVLLDFPLIYEGGEIGYVEAYMEDQVVTSVAGSSLAQALGDRVTGEIREALSQGGLISVGELEGLGIMIAFRPQTMDLTVRLSGDIFSSSTLSFGPQQRTYSNVRPPDNFGWFNQFTLSADHDFDSDYSNVAGDWTGSMNIGGYRGLNLLWSATANYNSFNNAREVRRGPVRAFHDMPAVPLRIAGGDISTPIRGHLAGESLGGISVESAYHELQPTTRISPTRRQEIVMEERGDVEIYVNGGLIRTVRLAPGRYELADIPLMQGSNDIEVMIFYVSGETETVRFSQFYNALLYQPGFTNFSFASGYRAEPTLDGSIVYSDDLLTTATIEHGVFSWFTLGAQGQYSDYGHIYGLTSVLGSPIGSISLRGSKSVAHEVDGHAFSIEWQHQIWGARNNSPNIRVAYDHYKDFYNRPWSFQGPLDGQRWLASYTAYFGNHFSTRVSYREDSTLGLFTRREQEAQLSYFWKGLRLTGGARQITNYWVPEGDYELFFNITFNQFDRQSGRRYRARYDSTFEQLQLGVGNSTRNVVGAFAYDASYVQSPSNNVTSGRINYNANRARIGAYGQYLETRAGYSGRIGGQMTTAIAVSGTQIGWGRGGAAPFTVVNTHPSLGAAKASVNPTASGVEAYAGSRLGGLIASRPRYQHNIIEVDVPDVPVGYDLGGGVHTTHAGAVTGTSVLVGSDAHYSVLGILLDGEGAGVRLQAADLFNDDITQRIFTNAGGRFIAEGLRPGKYQIRLLSEPSVTYELVIDDSGDFLLRIGELTPIQ